MHGMPWLKSKMQKVQLQEQLHNEAIGVKQRGRMDGWIFVG